MLPMRFELNTLKWINAWRSRSRSRSEEGFMKRSINPVLLLFCLIVAFMLGFLASSLVQFPSRTTLAHEQQQQQQQHQQMNPQQQRRRPEATSEEEEERFMSRLRALPDDLRRFHYECRKPPLATPAEARKAVLAELFDGESPFTGFPPPHIAAMVKPQRIKGWGSHQPVFERLLLEVRPRVIVELGTFLGASAIHMAQILEVQQQNWGTATVIFCLDDFRGWPGFRKTFKEIEHEHGNVMLYNQFLQNVVFSNTTATIVPVPFATTTGIRRLCELGVEADLIEVDAGHDFHSVWADINLAWSLMRSDGKSVMFGHDYFTASDNHGVRRAVDLFAKLNGLRVEPDGQHWIYRQVSEASDDPQAKAALKKKEMKRKKKNPNSSASRGA